MSKSLLDYVSIIAGLWGAILSSALFIHKLYESSRKIHLRFTHMEWGEYQELCVTNIGQKPIEIIDVGIHLTEQKKTGDPFEQLPIFPDNQDKVQLPFRLSEGESMVFCFQLDHEIIFKKKSFYCYVKDSTGKKYKTSKIHVFDLKYHVDIPTKYLE